MESTIETLKIEVAEIEISYRPKVKPSQRPRISGSRDAEAIFRQTWDLDKIELVEEFKVMLLNRANRVLGIMNLSQGGMTGTVADPRIIFGTACKAAACGIIVAHNHPSGNLLASQSDIETDQETQRRREGAGSPSTGSPNTHCRKQVLLVRR